MEMWSAVESSIGMMQSAVHANSEDIQLLWCIRIYLSLVIKNMIYSFPQSAPPCSNCAFGFDRRTIGNVWVRGHRKCGAHAIQFAGRVLGETSSSIAGAPRQHL